ncbi:hypothetical protein IEQ34_026558 [Dendrobium chrysotoxum]|uniref:Uncharacterized protein n=1 Tax=Dendrobium chrysotoxum TaxID=161865 RepID=A0AAV7FLT0_DENCH|nr:hypothetical protein IEQ34_026558 [Dendrobium chrysotoxum]
MEGLTSCGLGARFPLRIHTNSSKNCPFSRRRPGSFLVLAARDNPELDKWEQMELKFGRLLGEDPKLTLAKMEIVKLRLDDVPKRYVVRTRPRTLKSVVLIPNWWSFTDNGNNRYNGDIINVCSPIQLRFSVNMTIIEVNHNIASRIVMRYFIVLMQAPSSRTLRDQIHGSSNICLDRMRTSKLHKVIL